MAGYTNILKNALKNKVLQYIFSRYATYSIQFVNSIFIAVYLGPYYLGIWGFITLIIQYLNQINLGIAHSVNAIIAIHKNKEWYVQKVIGTSLTMLIGLSIAVILIFIANKLLNLDIGSKYNFSNYAPAILVIGILGYFNSLFSNIFRVYGKVIEIAVNQSAFPVLMLLAILFFKGENLLWALVGANLTAYLLSLILYLINTPVKLKPIFNGRLVKTIQIKGWHLFVYNTSFYLIIISTKTFVSAYYSVEEFGYFTFAFALANVVLLLLQSFSFLFFPKLINRLASATSDKATELLVMIRKVYISTSHVLIHFAILIFPLLILFFPQYNQSSDAFRTIALTVVLYTNSFGYSGLLIAKGMEKILGYLSLFALIINVTSAYIVVEIFQVRFVYVIIATMLTYFLYVFLLGYLGRKKLDLNLSFFRVFNDLYPLSLLIPYIISWTLIITSVPNSYFTIPLFLFILMNWKDFFKIREMINKIILNPAFINI
jgi:O-antigen/teichoic acid export membrane protein